MTRVPVTTPLGVAVTMIRGVLERTDLLGAGTVEDPLFPISVKLIGENGNSVSIILRIEQAIRRYLRGTDLERRFTAPVEKAIRDELKSVCNHDEFLIRVMCLVNVG